jgi:lipopolysaccharide biosynthesis protein
MEKQTYKNHEDSSISSKVTMTDTCLFAHYDPKDCVAEHVLYYLKALKRCDFDITLISTSKLNEVEKKNITDLGIKLILRENSGLDFGSWAEALHSLKNENGNLNIQGRLLLANDSVYGPIGDLSEAIKKLLALPGDVHGMVESMEVAQHIQSWFMLFSPAVYNSSAFKAIFAQNFNEMPKSDVILAGEIGVSVQLREAGFTLKALSSCTPENGSPRAFIVNPTHYLWRSLIENDRVPFLKVELLRKNPGGILSIKDWKDVVGKTAPDLVPLIKQHIDHYGAQAGQRSSFYRPLVEWFISRDEQHSRHKRNILQFLESQILSKLFQLRAVIKKNWQK